MATNERLGFGVLLGVALVSTPAAAQEARKFSVGLHATVEHDSNVARSSDAQAALRGITPSDTSFAPSISIDYAAPIGRQSVFLAGSAGYVFYDKNDDLNRERIDLTGGANVGVGPCLATPSAQYTRGIRYIDDALLEVDPKNIQETKRVGVKVSCTRPTGLGLVASGYKGWVDNSLSSVVDADYESTSLSAGVTYSRPALGMVTAFGSYEKVEYPNRIVSDGYEVKTYGVTFERKLGARLQGTATLAYTTVDQLNPIVPTDAGSYDGMTYGGAISFRASSRLTLEGTFNRDIKPSWGVNQTYDKSTDYGLTADYDLGSRIRLSVGGRYVDRDSGAAIILAPIALTSSETTNVFGALRYKQSERLSFILQASREERTTNAPQFDYTSNRIGLTANATF